MFFLFSVLFWESRSGNLAVASCRHTLRRCTLKTHYNTTDLVDTQNHVCYFKSTSSGLQLKPLIALDFFLKEVLPSTVLKPGLPMISNPAALIRGKLKMRVPKGPFFFGILDCSPSIVRVFMGI
jgi:hypothetical protein